MDRVETKVVAEQPIDWNDLRAGGSGNVDEGEKTDQDRGTEVREVLMVLDDENINADDLEQPEPLRDGTDMFLEFTPIKVTKEDMNEHLEEAMR